LFFTFENAWQCRYSLLFFFYVSWSFFFTVQEYRGSVATTCSSFFGFFSFDFFTFENAWQCRYSLLFLFLIFCFYFWECVVFNFCFYFWECVAVSLLLALLTLFSSCNYYWHCLVQLTTTGSVAAPCSSAGLSAVVYCLRVAGQVLFWGGGLVKV
jgi:hypothetical protein